MGCPIYSTSLMGPGSINIDPHFFWLVNHIIWYNANNFHTQLVYGSILLVVEKWLPNGTFNIEESNKLV